MTLMDTDKPLLRQWGEIKKELIRTNGKDVILFYRLGDFYETFYEDAILVSKVLGITLTKKYPGVPLAGVPYHSVSPYINKLVKSGYKVAICEQLESPKPGKLVKRGVVEIISQGTVIDEIFLDHKENNYLSSISSSHIHYKQSKESLYGFAYVDLSTGEFKLTELNKEQLIEEIKKLKPVEILIEREANLSIFQSFNLPITYRDAYEFSYEFGLEELKTHFNVASLDGFGCSNLKLAIGAAGAIISYLRATKKKTLSHIKKLTPYFISEYLIIDDITRRNLEITRKIDGSEGEGTLLHILDNTSTAMGKRLLRNFINFPLTDINKINNRLDKVEELVKTENLIENLQLLLSKIPDIERIITKISMEKCNARDLLYLCNGLEILPKINNILPQKLSTYKFDDFSDIINLIRNSIVENPPPTIQEGGIIKTGFNKELDDLHTIIRNGKKWLLEFEYREKKRTGIQSLKVGFNNIFGYYIEITKPNLKYVPQDYIRKQTTAGGERFITEELKQYEEKILTAEEKIKQLEYEIFCNIRKKVTTKVEEMQATAKKIAELDVFVSFADCAKKNNYIRPQITEEDCIIIKDGRHPVIEKLLPTAEFIANPTNLTKEERIYIITGPNMAGKSTYLRQVALITIMAHIGSFVPASYAKIGICDRIFTRIGASDDLSRGVSTFLAEMNECANILNNATEKSLVILDEIGRGTSTFDGMAIAWSVIEYILKKINCKTLFATHYHELTRTTDLSSKIKNYHIAVRREQDNMIFLYQLRPGVCDESYGVDVAKLAGIPYEVIERADNLLQEFKSTHRRATKYRIKEKQSNLFIQQKNQQDDIYEEIKKIDPNKITPIDALLLIKKLKEKIK